VISVSAPVHAAFVVDHLEIRRLRLRDHAIADAAPENASLPTYLVSEVPAPYFFSGRGHAVAIERIRGGERCHSSVSPCLFACCFLDRSGS